MIAEGDRFLFFGGSGFNNYILAGPPPVGDCFCFFFMAVQLSLHFALAIPVYNDGPSLLPLG